MPEGPELQTAQHDKCCHKQIGVLAENDSCSLLDASWHVHLGVVIGRFGSVRFFRAKLHKIIDLFPQVGLFLPLVEISRLRDWWKLIGLSQNSGYFQWFKDMARKLLEKMGFRQPQSRQGKDLHH